MDIKAINCEWLEPINNVRISDSLSNLNWSGPIKPLLPINVFGKSIKAFQIGKYGQLKFLTHPEKGWFVYSSKEHNLPQSIDKLIEGWQVIGFGEPFRLRGCGVGVYHGTVDGNYVITFDCINLYNNLRQKWQYVISARKYNEIIVNYKSVFTGYKTIVGAIGDPKKNNADSWYPLENHNYRYTALLFNTSPNIYDEHEDEVIIDKPEPVVEPDIPSEVPTDEIWINGSDFKFPGDTNVYRLQKKLAVQKRIPF